MGVDVSIYQGVQPAANPFDTASKALAFKDAQRRFLLEDALTEAGAESGGDPEKMAARLMSRGHVAPALQIRKTAADEKKAAGEAQLTQAKIVETLAQADERQLNAAKARYKAGIEAMTPAVLRYRQLVESGVPQEMAITQADAITKETITRLVADGVIPRENGARALTARFDPVKAENQLNELITWDKHIDNERQARAQRETERHNTETERLTGRGQTLTDERTRAEGAAGRAITVRGQNMTDARAREAAGNQAPPAGFRWNVDRTALEAIPGGPATNMSEAQVKQVIGVNNTRDAITQYREALKGWSLADMANPNARGRMGTVYKNMLLQAKEAYNLGVLNGPDYEILQQVITDPTNWRAGIMTKAALDDQAAKLDEIMGRVGKTAATQGRQAEPPQIEQAPAPAQRVSGRVYQTPRGPMKWTGTGWLPTGGQ